MCNYMLSAAPHVSKPYVILRAFLRSSVITVYNCRLELQLKTYGKVVTLSNIVKQYMN
jgi:hypothetical protein